MNLNLKSYDEKVYGLVAVQQLFLFSLFFISVASKTHRRRRRRCRLIIAVFVWFFDIKICF